MRAPMVDGTLRDLPDERWTRRCGHVLLDTPSYDLYLDHGDDKVRRLVTVVIVGFGLLQIAGWVFWFRDLQSRRRRAT